MSCPTSQRGEEGLPLLSHHYSHFDAMRRVCPSSSCHYSHFDVTRRVCPSSSCRYFCFDAVSSFPRRNSPFRCGYRSTALMYIYIFLYMTIFKVYLLDFYPWVVETRHLYPRNPYPCAWVQVSTGTGTGPAGDTQGLPVPFTSSIALSWPIRQASENITSRNSGQQVTPPQILPHRCISTRSPAKYFHPLRL